MRYRVVSCEGDTAAAEVLGEPDTFIEITESTEGITMMVQRGTGLEGSQVPWTAEVVQPFPESLISAESPEESHTMLICRGTSSIAGIVRRADIGGGGGPGTWVADEEGTGGDGNGG